MFSKHTRGKRGHPEPAQGSKALATLKAFVLREIKRKHRGAEEKRLKALSAQTNGRAKSKPKIKKKKSMRLPLSQEARTKLRRAAFTEEEWTKIREDFKATLRKEPNVILRKAAVGKLKTSFLARQNSK
jgi:hypothetical protein